VAEAVAVAALPHRTKTAATARVTRTRERAEGEEGSLQAIGGRTGLRS
jgi:hypothetical protein